MCFSTKSAKRNIMRDLSYFTIFYISSVNRKPQWSQSQNGLTNPNATQGRHNKTMKEMHPYISTHFRPWPFIKCFPSSWNCAVDIFLISLCNVRDNISSPGIQGRKCFPWTDTYNYWLIPHQFAIIQICRRKRKGWKVLIFSRDGRISYQMLNPQIGHRSEVWCN